MLSPVTNCCLRACFNQAEAAKLLKLLEPGDLVWQPLALLQTNLQILQPHFRLAKMFQMKDLVDV